MYEYATSAQSLRKENKRLCKRAMWKYLIHVVFCRVTQKKNDRHGNRHTTRKSPRYCWLSSHQMWLLVCPIPHGLPRWRIESFSFKKRRGKHDADVSSFCSYHATTHREDGIETRDILYPSAKLTAKQNALFWFSQMVRWEGGTV